MKKDTRYCHHCDTDTLQLVVDSNHERDSSGDWRECLTCHWWYSGFDGRYHPPRERSDE